MFAHAKAKELFEELLILNQEDEDCSERQMERIPDLSEYMRIEEVRSTLEAKRFVAIKRLQSLARLFSPEEWEGMVVEYWPESEVECAW